VMKIRVNKPKNPGPTCTLTVLSAISSAFHPNKQ